MEELAVQGALIYDGSGAAPFLGSVTLSGERITGVYPAPEAPGPAREMVDGRGMALCPGFVDTHTHSDMVLLRDGRQEGSLSQGVTTEIIGQDGLSYAPLSRKNLWEYAPYLKGLNGLFDEVPLDFETTGEYLSRFQGRSGVNVAYLVPHCALRLETAGFENRPLTEGELRKACEMVKQGIEEGACGFSTGLSYFPGAFSDTRELVEICRAVREAGGVYVTHLRTVFQGPPFDKVEEALAIARRSGVALHFSHYRTGGDTIGHTAELMEKIDQGVREGLDITLELYPYPYGASYAPMFVPPWANEGGMKAILARLADPVDCERIAGYIDAEFPDFDGMISYAGRTPELMGQTFGELARLKGVSKGTLMARLLREEELALGFHDLQPDLGSHRWQRFAKDVFELLARPYYMVGSDAIHLGDFPHPRAYGTYSRLLRLAREGGFPLETLIQRMTELPCRRFGFRERGRVQAGYYADLVLFSPQSVTDRATVHRPRLTAEGIDRVWVNGRLALCQGKLTDLRAGRVLTRTTGWERKPVT